LAGRERRESERVIRYWEKKLQQLGKRETVAALGLGDTRDLVGSLRDRRRPVSRELLTAALRLGFCQPARPAAQRYVPMVRQLPRHLSAVLMPGCGDAHQARQPIRMEGQVAALPRRLHPRRARFGTFNSCVVHHHLAA
jgi:hypothetical protein